MPTDRRRSGFAVSVHQAVKPREQAASPPVAEVLVRYRTCNSELTPTLVEEGGVADGDIGRVVRSTSRKRLGQRERGRKSLYNDGGGRSQDEESGLGEHLD